MTERAGGEGGGEAGGDGTSSFAAARTKHLNYYTTINPWRRGGRGSGGVPPRTGPLANRRGEALVVAVVLDVALAVVMAVVMAGAGHGVDCGLDGGRGQ